MEQKAGFYLLFAEKAMDFATYAANPNGWVFQPLLHQVDTKQRTAVAVPGSLISSLDSLLKRE